MHFEGYKRVRKRKDSLYQGNSKQDNSEQWKSLKRAFEKLRIRVIDLGCRRCTGMVAGVRARGVNGSTWRKTVFFDMS